MASIARPFVGRLALGALLAVPALLFTQSIQSPEPELQDWSGDIPAHIFIVDGVVHLERDGTSEAATEDTPLLSGDRLRTDDGRVEVLFADGSVLDVDRYSTVDLQSDDLLRLLRGQVRLSVVRSTEAIDYRIDAGAAAAVIRAAGDYRVSFSAGRVYDPEVDLAVIRGSAELANANGRTLVRAGTHAVASAGRAPSLPNVFYTASSDEFDRWSEDRRSERLGNGSSQYLPAELQYYGGTLDRAGSWEYDVSYGRVWYPSVSTDWRPYSDGRWTYYSTFGWTWVGGSRWGWPTHHYGRWGLANNRWYWVPDRAWGPAWVSWAITPSYVSWCPLGINNRAVLSLSGSNYYNYQPSHGWTVWSSNGFRSNVRVTPQGSLGRAVPVSTWGSAEFRGRGPAPRGQFTNAPPLRGPAGRAVPRRSVNPPAGNDNGAWRATPQSTYAPSRDVNARPTYSTPQARPQTPDVRSQVPGRTQTPEVGRQVPGRMQTPQVGSTSPGRLQTPTVNPRPNGTVSRDPSSRGYREPPASNPQPTFKGPKTASPPQSYRSAPVERQRPAPQPPPAAQPRSSRSAPPSQPSQQYVRPAPRVGSNPPPSQTAPSSKSKSSSGARTPPPASSSGTASRKRGGV